MLNALRHVLLLTAFTVVAPAFAQDEPADPPRTQRQDAEDRVRQVERDGGRVLQAEPMQRGGREVYRLKVLTPEGRVRVLDDSRSRDAGRESRADQFEREQRQQRFENARRRSLLPERQREPDNRPDNRRTEPAPDAGSRRPPPHRDEGDRSGGRSGRD